MKNIILFIIFIPLLFLSIYLGFMQIQTEKKGVNVTVRSEDNIPSTSVPTTLPIKNQSITISDTSQIGLTIESPESGVTVDSSTIVVSGTTKPKISVAVNDEEIISNTNGVFKVTINLDEGENYISIVAYDEEGNVAEREIMVTRTTSDI